ncbi:MAG: hypothetical protein GY816_24220 [Cytophagales bacterium]|nr:hypothetical protein [Cytophagales bacterium]
MNTCILRVFEDFPCTFKKLWLFFFYAKPLTHHLFRELQLEVYPYILVRPVVSNAPETFSSVPVVGVGQLSYLSDVYKLEGTHLIAGRYPL